MFIIIAEEYVDKIEYLAAGCHEYRTNAYYCRLDMYFIDRNIV